MIKTDPAYMRNGTFAGVLIIAILMAMIAGCFPGFAIPIAILVLVTLLYRCYCAYMEERFSSYAFFIFHLQLAIAPLTASSLIAMSMHKHGVPLPQALLLTFIPEAMVLLAYIAARRSKPKRKIFRITRTAVEVDYFPSAPSKATGPIIGISTLFGASFVKSNYEHKEIMLLGFGMIVGLYVVFYYKDAIAGLRQLRAKERKTGIRYTFDNIEEIRQWRAKSWSARIFSFFYSKISHLLRSV